MVCSCFNDDTHYGVCENDAAPDPTVTHCLFQGNPDGDYYDENTTPLAGAAAVNALAEGSANAA